MGLFDRFKKSPTETTERAQSDVAPAANETPTDGQPKSLFSKFKDGLRKTQQLLNTDIRDLFKKEGRLVEDLLAQDLGTLHQGADKHLLCELFVGVVQSGRQRASAETNDFAQILDRFCRKLQLHGLVEIGLAFAIGQ